MSLNIDSYIFITFLIFNLAAGIFFGRGIKNIKEYALGNRNFSTMVIAATLVASWIGGSTFFNRLSLSYTHGLYYIWTTAGSALCFIIIGWIFSPRLGEFLGKLSIAEAMGSLYGEKVRIITAISGCIATGGVIAAQLKVSGLLFEYAFGIEPIYGVLIGSIIIAIYTTMGGIKSVTLTDVIQLFTFGTIIPTLAFFIFNSLDSIETLTNTLKTNELFNYKEVFDFTQSKSLSFLPLFLYMLIPGFEPIIFQRISMARNTAQVKKSFLLAGIVCLIIYIIMNFIGILILASKPGLETKDVVKYAILEYSYTGLKGFTLIGIMAMVMSSVDSFINATSVLFVRDFCKPLGIKFFKDELTESRITSVIITIGSLFLAMSGDNLLKMVLGAASFYLPIVTVPFIMAIFGFRTSAKSVLIAMAAGLSTVCYWIVFLPNSEDRIFPAMIMNFIFLFGSHYLLKQPGGWVGIKDESPLIEERKQRKIKFSRFIQNILKFNFFRFLKNNTPTQEHIYMTVSLFCMISIFAAMYTLSKSARVEYAIIVDIIFPSSIFAVTTLMSYPLWPNFFKNNNTIVIIWNAVIFYVLVCVGFLFAILSNFDPAQMMILMINLIILSVVVRWKLALLMMGSGVFIATKIFKTYIGYDVLSEKLLSFKFEVSYGLLLISAILVSFYRPQQNKQELAEAQIDLLDYRINKMDNELGRSLKIKSEFLNNISHEVRTPISGIASLSQSLYEHYDNLTEEQRRKTTKDIAKNSERLHSFIINILDLSKLTSLTYKINITSINLSNLLYDRIELCKKLYLNEKNLEFITNIDSNLIINCDEHYIKSVLDNLIVNAINYSESGTITIALNADDSKVKFTIQDEGTGIPTSELRDIFNAFVVGSKTYTPAGGRGVGLALCKKAIELHKGKINAQSNGIKGATFYFELPKDL